MMSTTAGVTFVGGKFTNGALTGAFSRLFNDLGGAWKHAKTAANHVYRKATAWHFEGRDALNTGLPTYEQAVEDNSPWIELSADQSVFHNNSIGKPESKFIHPDGREVVFDGDSLGIIHGGQYGGTYNYVNPAPTPRSILDVGGVASYLWRGTGHLLLDIVPYAVGGNVRGAN